MLFIFVWLVISSKWSNDISAFSRIPAAIPNGLHWADFIFVQIVYPICTFATWSEPWCHLPLKILMRCSCSFSSLICRFWQYGEHLLLGKLARSDLMRQRLQLNIKRSQVRQQGFSLRRTFIYCHCVCCHN